MEFIGINSSPTTPRKDLRGDTVALFGNSIHKSIQKSKLKSKQQNQQQNLIHSNQYLCTFLDTIGKKRSFDESQNGQFDGKGSELTISQLSSTQASAKKQCLSSSKLAAKASSSIQQQDRFIPHRANIDEEYSYFALEQGNENIENIQEQELIMTPGQRKLKAQLTQLKSGGVGCIENGSTQKRRLVDCRKSLTPAFDRVNSFTDHIKMCKESVENLTPRHKTVRTFPSLPFKVLDAPELVNDYYLNLLHWGQNNFLCVALGRNVYLWNSDDGTIQTLLELESEQSYVSSVQWSPDANLLAVGTSLNTVQLWDAKANRMVRELDSHASRVSSLSWQSGSVISSGGKDSMIYNHDHRSRRPIISSFAGHTQEVCGLTWSPDGTTLASGGNENMLCFWDMTYSHLHNNPLGLTQQSYAPRIKLDQHHIAAVKALAWCPWQRNILASGGGTADRNIKIWNSSEGTCIKSVDTGSQVCAIQWSDHYKELVSSHGFSDYQLIVWKYQDMTKLHELHGHTARVLHLAKSPCGSTICSASADETLRFWNIFDRSNGPNKDLACLKSPLSSSKKLRNNSVLLSTPGLSMSIR